MTATRREVLAQRLHDVHERIEAARIAAGRLDDNDQVQLVVVTKTFPARDVSLLAELGVTDVGENRDQEARAKRADASSDDLRWQMIGRLQRNKVSSVARWADELIAPLAGAVERFDRKPVQVLLQVSVDPVPDPGRGGADPDDVESLAEAVARHEVLHLAGVMAVAPHPDTGMDPRAAFDRL
ncbi:MAG: YggS family pyridoxal phosphate-dependent enzyme, partial [Actinomycetota bacterium]